ncbi:Low affinity iron permease-domain-containing protein [Paraphoma chrysanthemicola]|uniref:Low affinity iron permease-domain-containing protein n=1 Tax=Paraphoma chrysanthemicola TaxID=798071 RepID=A0A8K0RHA8_9PLEO|nr:Low affinity iron permease-domain-containing protein [Paraphoma chrysanthemicola]
MINHILAWLRAPGARAELSYAAPNQLEPDAITGNDEFKEHQASVDDTNTFRRLVKPRLLDRWLDRVVEMSGSEYIYLTFLVGLLTWAFLGIRYGGSSTYKIAISDAQAVVNLIFDAFLMRQQFNQHDNLVMVAGCLRSRITSHKRMLNSLIASGNLRRSDSQELRILQQQTEFVAQLPEPTWATKLSRSISAFLGHILTIVGYWVCIFVWLGFGPYCAWSVEWQLYINSATSALMVLLFAFLANVRERHNRYSIDCLKAIWKADSALELRLRRLTGDLTDNCAIVMPQRKRGKVQRAIDYYADLVGTLAGVAILVIIFLVWAACGPVLHFDSNWWLLIGTYAGLVGLNDGFVLKNVCQNLGDYEDEQFAQVSHEEIEVLDAIGAGVLEEEHNPGHSLSHRISLSMGYFCSHRWTVVLGVISIFGLIVGATAMRWSETGQLLCNIPPSIIESFFTLILITGHNVGEARRRADLFRIYERRLKMISFVDSYASTGVGEATGGDQEVAEVGVIV